MINDLSLNPLTLAGSRMIFSNPEKYLGYQLSINLSESFFNTVKRRVGLANKIIFEICSVIQDKHADCIHGLSVAFELFESTLILMLLQGPDCWFRINNKTMKMLEKIQLKFARVALTCSQGCPIPKLYSETGFVLMPH